VLGGMLNRCVSGLATAIRWYMRTTAVE